MKTQKKGLANVLKRIAITSFIMAIAVSCGQNNSSGNSNGNINGIFGGLGSTVINGQTINLGVAVQRLASQMQCANYGFNQTAQVNGNRIRTVIQVQGNGALYKPVVGITVEGDIAVVRSVGQGFVMEVFACQRPGMVNVQGIIQRVAQPLSYSFSCMDGLVADVILQGQQGQYRLALFPATPNQQAAQQVCGI